MFISQRKTRSCLNPASGQEMTKSVQNLIDKPDEPEMQQASRLFRELGEDVLGLRFASGPVQSGDSLESGLIEYLIELRASFRADKNWKASDAIRDKLHSMGIIIEDGKDGARWRKE